jgi:hypothetical protein
MLPIIMLDITAAMATLVEFAILPLAVLSVAVFWYCWIKDGLLWIFASLHITAVISKPKRGYARRSPVPSLFLI